MARSETSFKFEQSRVTEEISANCIQGLENEFRSPTFEDHRRTAIAVEATTARTTESTRAYTSAISDYRAVKRLHEDFKREAQRSSYDSAEVSANRAKSIRTDYFSKFFEETTRKFGISASRTFERISDEFEYRFRSEANHPQRATEYGASRDRTAIEADDRANNQENEFSRAISTKISRVNPTNIFTALDEIDRRRELQREQALKNDNKGYFEAVEDYYKVFWRKGIPVDVVNMECDFSKYLKTSALSVMIEFNFNALAVSFTKYKQGECLSIAYIF